MALLNAEQVKEGLGVGKPTAYAIIKSLNEELEEKGYLTVRGKIEENYLKERIQLIDTKEELEGK